MCIVPHNENAERLQCGEHFINFLDDNYGKLPQIIKFSDL